MNKLNEALQRLLETPKQGRTHLNEALNNALRQTGQARPTTDLGVLLQNALQKSSVIAPPPPAAPLDGTDEKTAIVLPLGGENGK